MEPIVEDKSTLYYLFNASTVGAGTGIVANATGSVVNKGSASSGTALSVFRRADGKLYIQFCASVQGTLDVLRTRGSTTVTEHLNGGLNIAAGVKYVDKIMVYTGDKIDFAFSGTGTINSLFVRDVGME